MMKKYIILLGMMFVLLTLTMACSGSSPSTPTAVPQSEEPVIITTEPTATEVESGGKVTVTFISTVHSSDLGGYAWLQEYLNSNDIEAADERSWTESARAGAVCYASVAPMNKSMPSAADGSFSVTFEAQPGSTFRILCDPDETHPAALGTDVFTVPQDGGTIDHAKLGLFNSGLWTPELGITNDLAAKAAGYPDAKTMFKSAGTCRVLAMPGEKAKIAVSEGETYGFYMEAPDTAGRVTMLTEESGAYIVIKEFEDGESESEIEIEFTDTSGAGLAWPTAVCPIKRGFSTDLVVLPFDVVADFTLPDANGNMVNLTNEIQENEYVVVVFYYGSGCEPCMTQLSQIENDHAKYVDKKAQVLAVAVQSEMTAKFNAKFIEVQFPILADSKGAIAEAFGVLEGGGLSTPSVFIINKDMQIVWHEISHIEGTGCGTERVPSQTILENLQ